jgi:hypothetical protein
MGGSVGREPSAQAAARLLAQQSMGFHPQDPGL